jgi:hypothetical protein
LNATWKETCISELQVIGVPAQPATPQDPEMLVGSLDGEPLEVRELPLAPLPKFSRLAVFCAQSASSPPCEPTNNPYEQRCSKHAAICEPLATAAVPLPAPPPGWKLQWITAGPKDGYERCYLAIEHAGGVSVLDAGGCEQAVDIRGHGMSPAIAYVTDAIPGGPPELVLVLQDLITRDGLDNKSVRDGTESLVVCGVTKPGIPGCTDKLVIARIIDRQQGYFEGVGADGMDEWHELPWAMRYRIERGDIILRKDHGVLDDPSAVGRYRLRR